MFHRLADTPSIGQKCDYIKSNYQKFPQGSHIIFYKKVSNESIQIIRILHKSMDIILQLDNS
jgi:toxin ParE1/3/4